MNAKLDPITIRGKEFELYLSDKGEFFTHYNSDYIKSKTYEGLREAIMRATKRETLRLELPALRFKASSIRHADRTFKLEPVKLQGLHGSNGNVLVKDSQGKTEQEHSWHGDQHYYRPMDEAEQAEFLRLHDAMNEATNAFERYSAERKIDIRDVVRKALEKANALD